jgi:hypothetical protein
LYEVARVHEHLLVLLVPVIELLPVERHVAGELGRLLDRRLVTPHRVRGDAIADADRPVAGIALARAMRGLLRTLQPRLIDVREREVIDRQVVTLEQVLDVGGVDDRLTRERHANTAAARLDP